MDADARVAIVTGGSSGIGLACGRLLAERGYDVVLTARTADRLQAAAEGIGARWVAGDSADEASFAAVVAAAASGGSGVEAGVASGGSGVEAGVASSGSGVEATGGAQAGGAAGRVDLLVHAAGVMAGTFVRRESAETFDAVIRTNLRSAFVVAAATLPVMPAGARMVFVSSSSAHAPQPGKAAYSASKAGLNAFAFALAKEVERDGVAVHVVTTGPVATPMLDDVHFPMRTLDVDDVAGTIVWLDTLAPNVVLPEVNLSSVDQGPFAPEPFVPEAARARGRTEI